MREEEEKGVGGGGGEDFFWKDFDIVLAIVK